MTKLEPCLGEEKLRDAFLQGKFERGKLKKGTKSCPQCASIVHTRTKFCECGYVFEFSYKKPSIPEKYKKWQEIDWKTLQRGSIIYVDSQDYWLDATQTKIHVGECGEYSVKEVRADGLLLHGKNGYCFQPMRDLGFQEKTGVTREKASILQKSGEVCPTDQNHSRTRRPRRTVKKKRRR